MTETSPSPPRMTRFGLLVEGGLALSALGIGKLVNVSPLDTVEFTWAALPGHIVAVTWGVAAAIPLILGLMALVRVPRGPLYELRRFVEQQIAPLFAGASMGQLALISVAAGLGEEMLFRGLLQFGLATWIGERNGTWIAMAIASLVFGLAHSISWTYVVLASLVGFYFGWLFWISGNLLVPIAAHAFYDFYALVYFVKWKTRHGNGLEQE